MKGCAFSGHRHIANNHKAKIRDLVARAVVYAYNEGCRDFYNGGAVGFDLLCAEVVLSLRPRLPGLRLCMLLPCINQDTRWSDDDRARYERILNAADSIECIAKLYFNGCMQARNRELVSRSDILIAYLGRDSGGTAHTVKLAESKGLRVYNLYPTLERGED